jgi:hypothetical protein
MIKDLFNTLKMALRNLISLSTEYIPAEIITILVIDIDPDQRSAPTTSR